MVESFFRSPVRIVAAVCLFPLFQMFVQFLLKGFLRVIFTCIEIEVENRILPPFFLQSIDGQSFEKLLLPLEVCLQSADQKALAEPARTAQKIISHRLDKLIYKSRLVYVIVSVPADFFEILYPYRVKFSHAEVF